MPDALVLTHPGTYADHVAPERCHKCTSCCCGPTSNESSTSEPLARLVVKSHPSSTCSVVSAASPLSYAALIGLAEKLGVPLTFPKLAPTCLPLLASVIKSRWLLLISAAAPAARLTGAVTVNVCAELSHTPPTAL